MKRVTDESDPWRVLGRLLAPTSGGLALRLARRLESASNHAAALDAVDRALALGVKGEGRYPEVLALELKAEIVDALDRPKSDVAAIHHQAGLKRYFRNEWPAAVKLFRQASTEDFEQIATYWAFGATHFRF